jgi:plastocyanin
MKRTILLAALLLGFATQAAVFDVYVYDNDFSVNQGPPAVDPTINVGDTIQWNWQAEFLHNVQSVNGSAEIFDSGTPVASRAPFEHTFTQVGTHWYYCVIHGSDNNNGTASGMAGTITVVPEPEVWGSAVAILLLGGVIARRALKRPTTNQSASAPLPGTAV